MNNAQILVNVLLVTATLSPARYHATPSAKPVATVAFLTAEGTTRRLSHRVAAKKTAKAQGLTYIVTATAYQAVAAQTDDDPFVTADNSRIKPHYSSKTRWLAISQDLLAHWGGKFQYGDKVRVRGISPQLDGVYTVHDTMNKRHRHCIDILTHPSEKVDLFTKDVKIQLFASALAALDSSAPQRARERTVASARLRTTARLASRRPQRGQWLSPAGRTNYFASAIL